MKINSFVKMSDRSIALMLSTQLVAPFILRSKTYIDYSPLIHAKKAVSRLKLSELDSMIEFISEQKKKRYGKKYPVGSWVWCRPYSNSRSRVVRHVTTYNLKSFRAGDVNETGYAKNRKLINRLVTNEEAIERVRAITPLLGKYKTDLWSSGHCRRTTLIRLVYTNNKKVVSDVNSLPSANGEIHQGVIYTVEWGRQGDLGRPCTCVTHVLNIDINDHWR
jgi:hypothetical protein